MKSYNYLSQNDLQAINEAQISAFSIKNINKTRIFNLIYMNDGLSRKDIQNMLGLSLPTIGQNITELLSEGLIEQSGNIGFTGGRKAEIFSVNPDKRYAIGLSITKHGILSALVDLCCNIVDLERESLDFESTDEYICSLKDMVERMISKHSIGRDKILGVGIALPAIVNKDNTGIFKTPYKSMSNLKAQDFSDIIGFPVKLCNDANSACYAELHQPEMVQESGFYLLLGEHIGGAFYTNNMIFTGDKLWAGEVGHITIHPGGKDCFCGKKGCFDAYCSASSIIDLTGDQIDIFFEKLSSNDPQTVKIWNEYIENLALVCNNLRMLLNVHITLGGRIGGRMVPYLDQLKDAIVKINIFETNADYIHVSSLNDGAICSGSAMKFITDFLLTI